MACLFGGSHEVDFAEVSPTKLHGDDLVLMEEAVEEGLCRIWANSGSILNPAGCWTE